MTKIRRAVSITEIMNTTFKDIPFTGEWETLLGRPQMSACWIIWGQSFNGKTSFSLQLAKELTKYGKVLYNSMEEGVRKSMKQAIKRNHMQQVGNRFHVVNESIEVLKKRLNRKKQADIIFIDSLQYSDVNKSEYKKLKAMFPKKLFIWVSHAEGKQPKGRFADFVRYDCDVKIHVEGYKAFCMSRLSGNTNSEYTIWHLGAEEYWGTKL